MTGWESVRLIDAEEASTRKANNPKQHHYSSVWFTEIWKQHAQALCSLEDFSRVAIKHLRALSPRPELQQKVKAFSKAHNLEQCVGIHIRMTDNVHSYDWSIKNDPDFVPEKISSIDGFQAAIRECEAQGKRVLVCTE